MNKLNLPIKTWEGNLIFSQNGCYAAYKLDPVQYNYITNNKKFNKRDELEKIIIGSNSNHIKILGKPVFKSVRKNNEEFKKTITGPMKEQCYKYLDAVTNYLVENYGDQAGDLQRYILIKLKKKNVSSFKSALANGVKDGINSFINSFNTEEFSITMEELEGYKRAEKELFDRVKVLARANEMDVEWLSRQPFYRGIGEPRLRSYVDKDGEPQHFSPTYRKIIKNGEITLSPHKHEITSLGEGKVDFNNFERYVSIEHGNGKISYQSFLAVADLPPTYFPNEEWIYHLNKLPFPVEWCFDIDVISQKAIESKIRGRRKKTIDQIENIVDERDLPEEVIKAELEGKDIENEVSRKKSPYTLTNVNFCIACDDLEELKRRVNTLVDYFGEFSDNGIEVQNPISDQEKLFMEFLPGSSKQSLSYSKYLPIEAITSSMPHADDFIGEDKGFIMGFYGALRRPVYFDPRNAALHDKSPASTSTGGLGGGKTHLIKFLTIISALVGGKSVLVDPKCENVNWDEFIPFLKGYIERMTLSGKDEDRGKLDPFMVYDIRNKVGQEKEIAISSAYQAAVSNISTLLDVPRNSDMSLAIQSACRHAAHSEIPCMERVIEFAKAGYKDDDELKYLKEEFDKLYRYLENYKKFKISALMFGDGTVDSITFNKPITILQIQGLKIPHSSKHFNNYTLEEVMSQVIMGSICSLLEKAAFAQGFVYIGFDESWFAKRSQAGLETLENIRRQGRSLFTTLHIVDQNPSGIIEEERNQISTKYVYRTENINEARSALRFLDLEETKSNLELVMNMPERHVLYQDYKGRTALVNVDVIFDEFNQAFNTRPKVLEDQGDVDEK